MGRKLLDTYEKWEEQGILKKRLKDIQELVFKNVTQKKIAEFLGVTEKTLIKLKKKHKKLEQAFIQGNDDQKDALFDVVFKKAMGFKESTTQRTAENTKTANNNKKGKVVITEKYYPPDLGSAKFLLNVKHGVNERWEEIKLMRERMEKEEEWHNENYNDFNK